MGLPIVFKRVIMFIPNKLIMLNDTVNKVINLLDVAGQTFTYVTYFSNAAKTLSYLGKVVSAIF